MTSPVWFRVRLVPQLRVSFLKALEELAKRGEGGKLFHLEDVHVPDRECTIRLSEEMTEVGNITQQLSLLLRFLEPEQFTEIEVIDGSLPRTIEKTLDRTNLRKTLRMPDRPLSAACIPEPHWRTPTTCLEAGYHLFAGGIDLVMDHPLLTSFSHNTFEERVAFLSEEEKKQTKLWKGKKWYAPNVTARTIFEMERRCMIAKEHELTIVGVDSGLIGLSALASLGSIVADHDLVLLSLPGPECIPLPFEKKAILSREFSAKLKNSFGIDIIASTIPQTTPPSFPLVFGLREISDLEDRVKKMGHDLILDGSDIAKKHPEGLQAGAKAFQKALEAADRGIDLNTEIPR